ncbi:ankyrin repeat and LEM domain-containing protein 1 isoform X2 [Drosophila elegans]|uniref:ankyrin repeat and LEM domain-containing protein 1 isoform X2 n=1 Tax=Drosophila elegans TaxID=30023 RepID=UPI001BC8440E|nr:ankyrin repeat and LEM domain-containing protein 1 isoform X2 [Drosophila elegans]
MSKLLVFSFIQTSPLQLRNFFNNLVKARGINYSLGTLHKHHTSFSAELEKTINSEISFNNIKYLYKVTNKLRERAGNLHKMDVWYTFLRAIFYVGKGKATRPYVHLKKAQKSLDEVNSIALVKDPKLALIVSIWRAKHGVLLMQAFHSISSEDAQTREASIIDALSMNHLTNRRLGVYCGPARSSLSSRERKYLGIALLHKLLGKFLATEECELYPLKSTKNFKDKAAIGA